MEKTMLPPADTDGRQGSRIIELTRYWKPGGEHDRRRRNERNAQREEANRSESTNNWKLEGRQRVGDRYHLRSFRGQR